MPKPPRAVLFDFDGVLADTENVHVTAWERTFARMGLELPPEICARAAETDDRVFLAEVWAEREIEAGDLDGWIAQKQGLARALLADAPRLYEGAAELVRMLRGHARLAVVTTAWRENVAIVLGTTGLAEFFDAIVAKEDVTRPKPDGEPYRTALRRLEVDPGEAVAVEDSPTGLASAQAVGLRCLAVGHRRQAGAWSKSCEFLHDLADPARVLTALGFHGDR